MQWEISHKILSVGTEIFNEIVIGRIKRTNLWRKIRQRTIRCLWSYSQEVRQRTATPLSPVQIGVAPPYMRQ